MTRARLTSSPNSELTEYVGRFKLSFAAMVVCMIPGWLIAWFGEWLHLPKLFAWLALVLFLFTAFWFIRALRWWVALVEFRCQFCGKFFCLPSVFVWPLRTTCINCRRRVR